MNPPDQDPVSSNDGLLRTAQVIATALVAGTSIFLLIAVILRATGKQRLLAANPWNVLPPERIISLIALFVGAFVLVASFLVPKAIVAATRKANLKPPLEAATSGRFDGVFLNQLIIGMALLECGAYFNGIAFILEGRIPNLIAALVMIVLTVARFPTRGTLDAFAENQEALLFEERQSA